MKSLVITALALTVTVAAAFAQTPSPSPATAPEMRQDQKAKTPPSTAAASKRLIRKCDAEAKSKEWFFRRSARREAFMACIAKTSPRLARAMKCHQDAVNKGARGRQQINSAVKACMENAH